MDEGDDDTDDNVTSLNQKWSNMQNEMTCDSNAVTPPKSGSGASSSAAAETRSYGLLSLQQSRKSHQK